MAPKHVSMAPMVPMAPEPAVPEQTAPEPARRVVAAAAEAAADVASPPRLPPPSNTYQTQRSLENGYRSSVSLTDFFTLEREKVPINHMVSPVTQNLL